jgi:hypothetical protein
MRTAVKEASQTLATVTADVESARGVLRSGVRRETLDRRVQRWAGWCRRNPVKAPAATEAAIARPTRTQLENRVADLMAENRGAMDTADVPVGVRRLADAKAPVDDDEPALLSVSHGPRGSARHGRALHCDAGCGCGDGGHGSACGCQ